jgi:DNA polymerase III sliding clamp (beta) subunit (PCNA family)
MGNLICEVIPYKTFKEKIKIIKKYEQYDIEVYKDFILISTKNYGRN